MNNKSIEHPMAESLPGLSLDLIYQELVALRRRWDWDRGLHSTPVAASFATVGAAGSVTVVTSPPAMDTILNGLTVGVTTATTLTLTIPGYTVGVFQLPAGSTHLAGYTIHVPRSMTLTATTSASQTLLTITANQAVVSSVAVQPDAAQQF